MATPICFPTLFLHKTFSKNKGKKIHKTMIINQYENISTPIQVFCYLFEPNFVFPTLLFQRDSWHHATTISDQGSLSRPTAWVQHDNSFQRSALSLTLRARVARTLCLLWPILGRPNRQDGPLVSHSLYESTQPTGQPTLRYAQSHGPESSYESGHTQRHGSHSTG